VLIKSGQEREIGALNLDDMLEVTSEDGTVVAVYELVFEDELTAFVTSDIYTVSQDAFSIEVPENTTVESLLAGLSPAPEAMVVVLDVDMNEKSTGTVLNTDMVQVTSGDGKNSVTYSISVIVSVYNSISDNLQVYPNPAQDILFVKNIPADTYVRISDITGRMHSLLEASEIIFGKLYLSGSAYWHVFPLHRKGW